MDIETGIIEERHRPYKKVNAPFGYFGSKNKLALQLCEDLPPHYCWVEAFCGSASLTLAKEPAPIEVINDIDNEIVNLFKQLRTNSERLCSDIALTPYAREELLKARIEDENDGEIERARKFLVQSMMAINGVFGVERSGFSSSNSYSRNNKEARVNRWYNLPDRLTKVVERLKNVRVENRDAIELLKRFVNRPATLVYLDPPYLGKRTNGYNMDMNDREYHSRLLDVANKAKCMVFISGYDNELYDSVLSNRNGWLKKTIETETKDSKGNSHARTEVVWMNQHFIEAQIKKAVPINLTEKERKLNKLNPERK
ncbi:DNA adenine methylase [Prolixibacter denitrificans]|uniref:site-specific DNA-methyltransferase (adenine-specific) n=1 Tax=Prolixibacter denitrificans TaxID=1541063 RepID=A0A2P8C5R7_9BACT|nr:DNA adenine methylase [Prolixibacter denitrificans]PSK80309.1 DNA adenine methylase [Prolixibacter denitrificans]GET23119.1 SAM-dependent methyltransferase [Prolixibacter denitrificans]